MASTKSRTKRNIVDVISFAIPGHDTYQMTVKEIVSKIEKDRIENMDEAVQTLIAVWTTISCRTENLSNVADIFHSLFRKTSLTILSVKWIKVTSAQKRQMAKVLTKCSQVFGPLVEKATRLCTVLVMAVYDPWGEPALNQLVEGQIDFTDTSVGEFVNSEPEELLLTRVESLTEAGHVNAAIQLCKSCLRHCVAIMTKGDEQNCCIPKKREKDKAYPFIENMLVLLHNQGDYLEVIKEASKLKCHDGVNLIEEITSKCSPGNASLPEMLSHFFLARDINLPSTYCCTKELMNLWCKLQVMQQRNIQEISNSAQRLICHAPSSAYLYLFVDRLWCQFGNSLLPLYLEMYVRGITSDMNFLDVVRVAGPLEKTVEMESHLASVFTKLSSLFSGLYDEIALECLLTAYSFAPAKEKLDKIHKAKERVSKRINTLAKPFYKCYETNSTGNSTGECTCEGRCSTPTKDSQNLLHPSEDAHPVYNYHFPHLILDGEVKGVPHVLLKDFVSVLECMRYRHLRASDDWETIKRNCQEYLEKYTAPKQTETIYDSADSEMDSVSEDGDDNTSEIKISREQRMFVQSISNKLRKELKPKSHRKQRYYSEEALSLESRHSSRHFSAYNDVDKEIKKRKKKRKTKREKDREASLKKQFEEQSEVVLVNETITGDKEKQCSKSPLHSFSNAKNEIANFGQEVKVLITQLNPKLTEGESKSEAMSLSSSSIQNRNPVVILSDILSDNIVDNSKNSDGSFKNDFQYRDGDRPTLPAESDSRKKVAADELEDSSNPICNASDTVSLPQQVLDKTEEENKVYAEHNSDITKSALSSASDPNPNSEHVELPTTEHAELPTTEHAESPTTEHAESPTKHVELPTIEQKLATTTKNQPTVVNEDKSYATDVKLENNSSCLSVPTVRPDTVEYPAVSTSACVSNNKDVSENELQEKNKEDTIINKTAVQVICTTSSPSRTVTPLPLDSLPKKLQVQIERKGKLPPMSSMATLSIPLPVGVKHSSGNKVLSGRLVIPVNRLQRAVSSASGTSIKIEGDANCNKQQMLAIPNVILMKRNVNSDISDEETGPKKTNVNRVTKNQKRMWATVRNLHGSIEWRKVSENDGSIAFQQKPVCAAKLRSGGVALSGPLYMSSGKEVDKSDIPVVAARNISPSIINAAENANSRMSSSNTDYVPTTVNAVSDVKLVPPSTSSTATAMVVSSVSVPVLSGSLSDNLQATVTDVTSARNSCGVVHTKGTNASSDSFTTTSSVPDLNIAQNLIASTQPSSIKPVVTKQGQRLKFVTAKDNTNIASVYPIIARTTISKEIPPLTSTTEKGGAKNIIRLMPGGPGICENKIDFSRPLPATNICPQAADANSKGNFMESLDSDLPVNLSMPKKPSTVCVDNKDFQDSQIAFDNKQYPLRHSRAVSNPTCKLDLGSPAEYNSFCNKATSTLQMLLANSVTSVQQNKCSEQLTSTNPISSAKTLNNTVDKSLGILPPVSPVSSRELPLDFKKAYPNTNINCFVGLSPLSSPPPNEAKLSAIVANNTSRMKKERVQNVTTKADSSKNTEKDNKETFDVMKLIGQIRELAEAEKAAKTKEKRKSSQKETAGDNKNRKLSKKCLDSNAKANPLVVTKKYNCVLCSSSLTQKYGLKRHYRDVHRMEVSPEQSSESIVKQFNEIASCTDGTCIVKNAKRRRTKVLPQRNIGSSNLLSLADAAESEMQKIQKTLPGVDVAFPHLNIFHPTSSHVTPMPSHHMTQSNTVPMFSAASTNTSYYPQQGMNSSVLKWNDNNQTVSSTENTLDALVLDNAFYNNRVSDKPLPELGDCHSDLNESKQVISTSDVSLPVPSSFGTGNINFNSTRVEHSSNTMTIVEKNIESLLAINSDKNLPLTNCERSQDINRTCQMQSSERKYDTSNKAILHSGREWSSKDLKQISVNCIKLDKAYNQVPANLEIRNPCVDTITSHSKPEQNYQNVDCFSNYHSRKHGERMVDGSSDNAVDSEVSKLVAFMLHIDSKPYSQQKHLEESLKDDSDEEMKIQGSNLFKQDKSNEENKSDSLKSVRQRTRVRHSPNSSLKRSCPCCQDSEASIPAKRCRNISTVSKMARPPNPSWVNLERTSIQQRRSRKSLPPITRSSKRLRTRSSTTSLT